MARFTTSLTAAGKQLAYEHENKANNSS